MVTLIPTPKKPKKPNKRQVKLIMDGKIKTRGRRASPLMLCNADLQRANMFDIIEHKADMENATLTYVNAALSKFVDSSLYNARCDWADLWSTKFKNCDLRKCNFEESHVPSLRIQDGCDCRNARFVKVKGDGAWFHDANLRGANFSGAILTNACFNNSDLRGADFGGAILYGADFLGSNTEGADFSGAVLDKVLSLDDKHKPKPKEKRDRDSIFENGHRSPFGCPYIPPGFFGCY